MARAPVTPTPSTSPYPNDLEYLGDALAALRLRCRLRAAALEAEGLIARDPIAAVSGQEIDVAAVSAELAAVQATLAARLAAGEEPPALVGLQATFGLDDFERDVLLLALAPALDGTFLGVYGRLKGQSYRHALDIDVALAVLADGFEDRVRRRQAFTPNGRLLQQNLLLVGRGHGDQGDDFLSLELRLPGRLVTLLLGLPGDDASLHSFSRLIEPGGSLARVVLPPADKHRIVELVERHGAYLGALDAWGLSEAIPYGRGLIMLFSGPSGTGKTLTARAVASHLGRRLLLVDTARLTDSQRGFERNVDNLLREARLQNAVLFFDECEALFSPAQRATGLLPALLTALERFDGVVILATNVPGALDTALDRRILYRVDFEIPTPTLREAIWRVHLPERLPLAADVDVAYLGRRYEFAGGYIKNAVLLAAGQAASRTVAAGQTSPLTQADLMAAAHAQLRSRLNRYADREIAELRLEDLILEEDVKGQIIEIIEAVASQQIVFREWGFGRKFNKGKGLSALFDGEPGTGKTLSAEIIAAELGMTLFRVNVANVTSKYIGETEKNLTKVFAEARSAQSVLLFDEADSLFSKRVEVKHSNDRFANMEIGVLLQLIERYDGLVILTTNLKTSIDPAFERRLSFKLNFPFPEADTRAHIWEQLLPAEAPLDDDIDYAELGKCFELSGGSIKNAVLRAAYRAVAQGGKLSMRHFEEAAKRECQAAGKLYRLPGSDDGW
jgi:SpoVK/Ycf46/Vps4 family AAA+-type ATPase